MQDGRGFGSRRLPVAAAMGEGVFGNRRAARDARDSEVGSRQTSPLPFSFATSISHSFSLSNRLSVGHARTSARNSTSQRSWLIPFGFPPSPRPPSPPFSADGARAPGDPMPDEASRVGALAHELSPQPIFSPNDQPSAGSSRSSRRRLEYSKAGRQRRASNSATALDRRAPRYGYDWTNYDAPAVVNLQMVEAASGVCVRCAHCVSFARSCQRPGSKRHAGALRVWLDSVTKLEEADLVTSTPSFRCSFIPLLSGITPCRSSSAGRRIISSPTRARQIS